jgi:hypothetical protein
MARIRGELKWDRARNLGWAIAENGAVFYVARAVVPTIAKQPLAGGKPRQLTNFSSGRIFDFNWSSDHQRLLLTRGDVTSDVVLLRSLR